MDINELESYQKSDAVKFHSKLNPKLWNNEDLHDEVRLRLLDMAADFKEFLGIKDLEVNDVTISGSNAAYNYTGNSDIDLHLVVDMPKLEADEVYRELFTAKKYQYNDQHDYKIGNHEVELYVQPATDQHHSQGIYSVQASDWRRVPSRKQPKIDDTSVRHKYEDLGARIETAVASEDLNTIETLYDKIVNMRSIGLEKTGEFGVENVVFKLLRSAGLIDQLRKKRNDIKDQQLSITEKEKSQTKTNWGKFNGTFFPGHSHNRNARTDVSGSNASGSASETIKEVRRPLDMAETIKLFLKFCCSELNIDCPSITLKKDPEWSKRNGTFGRYNADNDRIIISIANRHPVDAMRTLAHELIHYAQDQHSPMPSDAGATGSDYENEANAGAGIIMRNFAQKYPEHFTLEEASGFIPSNSKLAHDPRYIMGLTKDIKPGETQRQAAKLGMTIDKKGSPPLLHKTAAKNTTPNKAYNLGLTESVDEGIKSLIKPSAYQLAADTLHTVLQRKQKENNNNFKHSLGWYASKIAGGHESIDTRELVDYYQKNYDTVLSEEEIAAEAYSTEQLDEMWGFAAARRVPSYMRGKVKKKKEKIEPSTHDKLVARRQAAAKGDKEAFRKDFKDLNEALGELPSSTEIYVDMDGVLADFFGEWSKSQGVSNWKDIKDPMKAIGDIKSIDDFWLNLPVLPQAKNLLNLIKKIKGSYNICTSPLADDPRSAPHKREWIKKNLAFFPPKNIYITHNKPQFAKNEDGTPNILVDDYGVNIDAWEAAGGIGFKYKDYKFDRTANAIKQQIDAPVEENFADLKGHGTDVPLGKYLYHVTYAEALEGMLKDGHLNTKGPAPFHYADYFSMTADPKYSVAGRPEVQIIIDTARVSKMETFEKYVDDWESTPGAGDWAKGADGDFESEYRVEETIPWDYVVAVKILKSKATPEIIELAKKRGVKLVGKENNVLENFADGKVKGKSRPGRVKKSGASCNGSVTALRKRAKNASGEKAKMYHWCANMKSGKKK